MTVQPPQKGRGRHLLPGFASALGFTWLYLSLVVLLPLSCLFLRASSLGLHSAFGLLKDSRVVASIVLSIRCSLTAGLLNLVLGGIVAWVLARYEFPGRAVLDAMVDLPFALPTSVAGITLTYLYSANGPLGRWLLQRGIRVAFTPLGIVLALTFVGLPFAVRTVQSVVQEMDKQLEEAARTLGATAWQTFWRVQLPQLIPALVTGFTLALARALGEYGSVVFISGNLPHRTEIAPLLVVTKLEQYDYPGAAMLAVAMLVASLLLLALAQWAERWAHVRFGAESES